MKEDYKKRIKAIASTRVVNIPIWVAISCNSALGDRFIIYNDDKFTRQYQVNADKSLMVNYLDL